MIKGKVFNIQHFCLDDGPGVRTTVFLKGCPLHCIWCHNPESQKSCSELMFDGALCVGCAACEKACPTGALQMKFGRNYEKKLCVTCGACTEACPSNALELAGKDMSVDEVMGAVLRDRPFYEGAGGLTLSGGEPLFQPEFAAALLSMAKEAGLHTCVETCGYAAAEQVQKLAENTDLFLYDWKLTDSELHKKYTGVDHTLIRDNLALLNALKKEIVLRCPIVPGINDTQMHFAGIAEIANTYSGIRQIELEPYHAFGTQKSVRLGNQAKLFEVPTEEDKHSWQKQLDALTDKPIKIG